MAGSLLNVLFGIDSKIDAKLRVDATRAALLAAVPSPKAGAFAIVLEDEEHDDEQWLYVPSGNPLVWTPKTRLGGMTDGEMTSAVEDQIGDLTALITKLTNEGYLA